MRRWRRKHTRNLLFGLIVTVGLLVAFEATLRAVDYRGDPGVADFRFRLGDVVVEGKPDPIRFWKIEGNDPHFNDYDPRIICMADSVLVVDVNKSYAAFLPKALHEAGYTKSVQVFNAGVSGYTSYQGRRYLEHELRQYHPAIVTVEFGWNDHMDSGIGISDHQARVPSSAVLFLQKRLAFLRTYRLLRTTMKPRSKPAGVLRVPLPQYEENLTAIVETSRRDNIVPILIVPPYLEQNNTDQSLHIKYIDATRAVIARTGAIGIDLVEQFRTRPDFFFFPEIDCVHFNEHGAALIAKTLAQTIVEKRLLDGN